MVVGATTAAHPLHCRHQSRAPTAVQTPECSRCCVPIATHPLHCTISCNRCGAPIGLHPSQRAHGTAPAAAPIAAPTPCLPGCPAHGLHPATCPGSTGVPTSQGQQSVTEPGARQRGRFALHSSRASPWPCWGARREGFPCRYPLRGSCARGARARQRGRGGVHPESPAAAASTLLSVAQPRAQRGRYLRGPRCQGKAGLAPKLRVGFCSRWKGTRFRCCLASCSLLRGGGGCGLVPGSREDAGAGLRAGRAPGAGWGAGGGPRARGLGAKPLVPFSRATLGHCPRVPPASRCPLGVVCSSWDESSHQDGRSCRAAGGDVPVPARATAPGGTLLALAPGFRKDVPLACGPGEEERLPQAPAGVHGAGV